MAATYTPTSLPGRLVHRVLRPFEEFAHAESSGGIVLLGCTVLALAWANSPWSESYFHLWETPITVGVPDGIGLTETLHHWINDGLMAVFFFLVGLEIKRELLVGELASFRQAALPMAAAVGGMVVPALIYVAIAGRTDAANGWGIPMATDIAFALGILALLGSRVPLAAKIFLTALAIVDDLGAVLVIALFYSYGISWTALGVAAGLLALLMVVGSAGVRRPGPYILLGIALWVAFLKSGIHATVAGVLLAMTIPARTRINEDEFVARARGSLQEFEAASGPDVVVLANPAQQEALYGIREAYEDAQAPLLKMENSLHGIVAFFIVPLFALANAGVRLVGTDVGATLTAPVTLGVVMGLVLGKPLGITLASWLTVRFGVSALPSGVSWRLIHGVSWLAGIGFTMSLFIATLAFGASALLDASKVGILLGSLVAGTVGWILVSSSLPRRAPPAVQTEEDRIAAD